MSNKLLVQLSSVFVAGAFLAISAPAFAEDGGQYNLNNRRDDSQYRAEDGGQYRFDYRAEDGGQYSRRSPAG